MKKLLILDLGEAPYPAVIIKSLDQKKYIIYAGISFCEPFFPVFMKKIRRVLFYPDPLIDEEWFTEWLLSIEEKERYDYIVPCVEKTQLAVAKIKNQLESMGAIVPIPDADLLKKVVNKTWVLKKAISLGINTPKTLFLEGTPDLKTLVSELGVPFIIKASSEIGVSPGPGKRYYVFHTIPNEKEFLKAFKALRSYGTVIAQEYIKGYGAGVAFLFNKKGRLIALTGHRRIIEQYRSGGPSVVAVTELKDDIIKQGYSLLRSIGWKGVAMVEFKIDYNGNAFFMELNPRFWGTLSLAVGSGVDFPKLLIEYYDCSEPTPVRYPKRTRLFVKVMRLPQALKNTVASPNSSPVRSIMSVLKNIRRIRGLPLIAEMYEGGLSVQIHKILYYLRRKWSMKKISKIDNIYFGPAPTTNIIRKLESKGVKTILDLREPEELKNVTKIPSTGHDSHIIVKNFSINDDAPPTIETLQGIFKALTTSLRKGEKVYVHCRLGRGRAPTIVTSYLLHLGFPLERACYAVTKARPYTSFTIDQLKFLYGFAHRGKKLLEPELA